MTSQYLMFLHSLLLFSIAFIAGGLNAVAGGGSFLTFPVLIFTGVPPIAANATNNTALWIAALVSAGAYRQDLKVERQQLLIMCGTSLLGGTIGSIVLLYTSPDIFKKLIPYLLLLATLIFTFSKQLQNLWKFKHQQSLSETTPPIPVLLLTQLAISIYGGFFGAGIGILMLATLSFLGIKNIHTMNALKVFLTSCINGVAVIPFMIAGVIVWHQALIMAVGASLGSYLCVNYIRKLPPKIIRYFVIFIAYSMTIYFFLHG